MCCHMREMREPRQPMNSSMLQLIFLGIVLAVGAAWIAIGGRKADQVRLRRLSSREDLSFDLLYEERYRALGFDPEKVRKALNDVALAIDIPASKLRPTDRFDVELAAERGWGFDDGVAVLVNHAAKKHRRADSTSSGSSVETVDDYIRTIATLKS